MIKYTEIEYKDWILLKNRSGYICVKHINRERYYKDDELHNEFGPAVSWHDGAKRYYLYGKFYGYEEDYTNEQWIRYCKLKAFD